VVYVRDVDCEAEPCGQRVQRVRQADTVGAPAHPHHDGNGARRAVLRRGKETVALLGGEHCAQDGVVLRRGTIVGAAYCSGLVAARHGLLL
jgi:hypothetical protein